MTRDEAIQKAIKLLNLSQSNNANEAALAAAKAQEILTKYEIDQSLLSTEDNEKTQEEEVLSGFVSHSRRVSLWKANLACGISLVNQCRVMVVMGHGLKIVGVSSDIAKVTYLFKYLQREVDRLTKEHGRGKGRSWNNNFRLGMVETINDRLKEMKAKVEEEYKVKYEDNSQALIKIDKALQNMRDKQKRVNDFVNGVASGTWSTRFRGDRGARQLGRQVGNSVNINNSAGSLGSGNKQLRG